MIGFFSNSNCAKWSNINYDNNLTYFPTSRVVPRVNIVLGTRATPPARQSWNGVRSQKPYSELSQYSNVRTRSGRDHVVRRDWLGDVRSVGTFAVAPAAAEATYIWVAIVALSSRSELCSAVRDHVEV